MASEIERKFLVKKGLWQPWDTGVTIRQGYLSSVKERVVRVRIKGDKAYLTVKGINSGISRLEFEYAIPLSDAEVLLAHICEHPLIEKTRHEEVHGFHTWEIDVFFGDNDGLVLAEVELASESDALELPEWAGEEVSCDSRYFNSNLIKNPYTHISIAGPG